MVCYMSISVDKAIIAKLVKSGEKFEILVDPDKALEVKRGKAVSLDDLLASQNVFEDARKGLRAPDSKLNKTFGTNDIATIAYRIIKEGEVQLTTEQRRQMLEERKKAIASMISARAINPQTNTPHPQERITNAMEKAKVQIDINKSVEEQIDSVVKAIQPIVPIKIEKVQLAIKVPPQFSGKAANIIRNFGSLQREEWGSDGSFSCIIEIPAGAQQSVFDKLNSLTHGDVDIKLIKK